MGLSQIGSRCLLVTFVSGLRRLPVPPANTTPFIEPIPPDFDQVDLFCDNAPKRYHTRGRSGMQSSGAKTKGKCPEDFYADFLKAPHWPELSALSALSALTSGQQAN